MENYHLLSYSRNGEHKGTIYCGSLFYLIVLKRLYQAQGYDVVITNKNNN